MSSPRSKIAAIITLLLCGSASAQSIEGLNVRTMPGRRTYYEARQTRLAAVQTFSGGAERPQDIAVDVAMTYAIRDLQNLGSAASMFEFTMLSLRKSVSGGTFSIFYDSRDTDTAARAEGKAFEHLLNKPIRVLISPNGRIMRVFGLTELMSEAADLAPANVRDAVTEVLGTHVIESIYGAFLVAGAPRPASAGAAWSAEYIVPLDAARLLRAPLSVTATAPSSDADSLASLKFNGVLAVDDSSGTPNAETGVVIVFREGKVSGSATWDLVEGQLASADYEQITDLATEIPAQSLTQNLKDTIKLSIRRITVEQARPPVRRIEELNPVDETQRQERRVPAIEPPATQPATVPQPK
jgi:hypothetical protein